MCRRTEQAALKATRLRFHRRAGSIAWLLTTFAILIAPMGRSAQASGAPWERTNASDPALPPSSQPIGLITIGPAVFFFATDQGTGLELWKSDGTPCGTVLVKDINPGPNDSGAPQLWYDEMRAVDNTLFFIADDGSHGPELWRSDGTAGGTTLVRDIDPSAPVACDSTLVIRTGATANGSLRAAGASDAQYGLTYSLVRNGGQGVAAIPNPAAGAFTYTPNPGTLGLDYFTFRASDGLRSTNMATVTLVIGDDLVYLPALRR
jgi:ELWxxDGT repeat protein